MGLTAWAQEQQSKHDAWREIDELKRQNAALVADNERLKALAIAGADLAIDVANTGIEAANRSDELQAENERLVAERDAFKAQAQALRHAIIIYDDCDTASQSKAACRDMIAKAKATPQQCLRDVQAKAAYSGYVAGWSFQQKPLEPAATQYAERVKAGNNE